MSPYITPLSRHSIPMCNALLCEYVLSKSETHVSKGQSVDAFQGIRVCFIEL